MDESPLSKIKPSPRVKQAAVLYATGVASSKKQASQMAGLHPNYLTMLTSAGNEEVNRIVSETQRRVLDQTVDTATILNELGRKALSTVVGIMEAGQSEALRLKAAIDLADRSPETSKVVRAQVTSLTLDGEDAQKLAEALLQSATVRQQHTKVTNGDFVCVDINAPTALPEKLTEN